MLSRMVLYPARLDPIVSAHRPSINASAAYLLASRKIVSPPECVFSSPARSPTDIWNQSKIRRNLGLAMIVRDHLPLKRTWPHVSKRLGLLFLFDSTIAILYTQFGMT